MHRGQPRPGLPRKGRPAAPVASPCPQRAALRERGEGPKGLRGVFHFRLMVVFTPWPAVLSSNQRAVTVLVWV